MTDLYVSLYISNYSPTPIQKVVSLVSRTGRDLQRYDATGYRQVVGYVQPNKTLILISNSGVYGSLESESWFWLCADVYRTDTRTMERLKFC